MADVTMTLALEAERLKRDAEEVRRRLDGIGTAAVSAGRRVDEFGTRGEQGFNRVAAFMNASQFTSGTTQIAGGIRSVVDQFDRLGKQPIDAMAGGLQGVARTMLEIARTRNDLTQAGQAMGMLAGQTKGLAGAFNVLKATFVANPILGIATLLSTAASAMALFSSNTATATEKVDLLAEAAKDLGDAMAGIRGTERLQDFYRAVGSPKFEQSTALEARQEAIAQAYARASGPDARPLRAEDFAALLKQPVDALPQQYLTRVPVDEPVQMGRFPRMEDYITPEGQRQAALQFGRDYQSTINERNRKAPEALSLRDSDGKYFGFDPARSRDELFDAAMDQAKEWDRMMAERRATAEEFGQVIGQGFLNIGQNINNAGQALAQFIQQLASLAAQRFLIDRFASAMGNSFGSTGAQRGADTPGGSLPTPGGG